MIELQLYAFAQWFPDQFLGPEVTQEGSIYYVDFCNTPQRVITGDFILTTSLGHMVVTPEVFESQFREAFNVEEEKGTLHEETDSD
jgi:hypothetical protein